MWTDGRTDIWDPPMLLGRLGGVDLKSGQMILSNGRIAWANFSREECNAIWHHTDQSESIAFGRTAVLLSPLLIFLLRKFTQHWLLLFSMGQTTSKIAPSHLVRISLRPPESAFRSVQLFFAGLTNVTNRHTDRLRSLLDLQQKAASYALNAFSASDAASLREFVCAIFLTDTIKLPTITLY